jgi:Na+-driven multidrug efflux pump
VFVLNALPMMLIMLMNGLLNIIDAAFLGHFVGTGCDDGHRPRLSRRHGADRADERWSAAACPACSPASWVQAIRKAPARPLASAHGLALAIAAMVMIAFLVRRTGGRRTSCPPPIRPSPAWPTPIWQSPCLRCPFSLPSVCMRTSWRNEGRAGLVALLSVGVTLANIALNYVLIGEMGLGVAGSAWGTALAQVFGLGLLLWLRGRRQGTVPFRPPCGGIAGPVDWGTLAGLGAPLSLSFIGMALVSSCVILALRLTAGAGYAGTIAAYGIVTRVLGFAFLPSMAIALALQSITGNNWGAGLHGRARSVLKISLLTALAYGLMRGSVLP